MRSKWPLLASLPDDTARAVLASARRRRFRRGESIVHEGDIGDAMHLIDTGRVAVRVTTPRGDVATVRILGPGDAFGEMAILAGDRRSATVSALEPVETLSLYRDHLDALLAEHPGVQRLLLDVAVASIRDLGAQLLDALYEPVPTRVARRLLDLLEVYGDGGPTTIPLTQDDLAGLAGTSRPTANKVLRELEERGAVVLARGRIEVLDIELLRKAAR